MNQEQTLEENGKKEADTNWIVEQLFLSSCPERSNIIPIESSASQSVVVPSKLLLKD